MKWEKAIPQFPYVSGNGVIFSTAGSVTQLCRKPRYILHNRLICIISTLGLGMRLA